MIVSVLCSHISPSLDTQIRCAAARFEYSHTKDIHRTIINIKTKILFINGEYMTTNDIIVFGIKCASIIHTLSIYQRTMHGTCMHILLITNRKLKY